MTTRIIQEASKATRRRITLFGTKAFTLAEVLIVLGIIGLIADMTIPTIIAKTEEKVTVSRLKKGYAAYESAFRMAVAENGTPDNWDLQGYNSPEGAEKILNILAPYMKFIKICGRNSGCFPDVVYKNLNGAPNANYNSSEPSRAKAILADGSLMSVFVSSANCSDGCGAFYLDINGFKGPNQWGKDMFYFRILKDRVVPAGNDDMFNNQCRDRKTQNGWSCAAWIIYNENMDYLHCSDLSWDGKKKCS